MVKSGKVQWIGGPSCALAGDEFSIRCQVQNDGDESCRLHPVLYDAVTGDVLYDYEPSFDLLPGGTYQDFPGTYPNEKLVVMPDHDWDLVAKVWVVGQDGPSDTLEKTIPLCGVVFADVAISRRYGNRLYLSGSINDIIASDEICVYYSRSSDTGIRNLKSDTSDYLYFKDTSGSYDLGANNRYIEFERAGYHWLQIWDVVGNCETPLMKRAEWLMDIKLPRFQYEVIFDLANPDIVDSLYLLQAEYAKYEAAGSWFINHEKPDCFTQIQPINTPEDDTPQSGWLSLGVEFGESPCAPFAWWVCPSETPQTRYWRGECSCDLFRNTLQPLGIPCSHLIAAAYWYSREPAWSEYVQCPE